MKYKVQAGKEIRVRDKANITGLAKGTLASNNEFFANPVGVPTSTEQWVQITKGSYAGYYGAIVYKGESFAELVDVPQPEPIQFPKSFILSDPSNPLRKAEYQLVRVIDAG